MRAFFGSNLHAPCSVCYFRMPSPSLSPSLCQGIRPKSRALEHMQRGMPPFRAASRLPRAVDQALGNAVPVGGEMLDDFKTDKRPVILYDGVCNMCNTCVNLALDQDKEGKLRFAALQSDAGKRLLRRSGRRPDDISSIVLVEEDEAYIKSDAVVNIGRHLGGPLPLFSGITSALPRPLRDILYDQVANNRYNIMGKRAVCRVSDEGFQGRFISS